jgi:molecular chaperone GrpE (heat shock protein)
LLSRLARRLGLASIPADVAEQLAEMQATVAALTRAQADSQQALSALVTPVEKTERQLARLGKEQFKANLLAETQRQNTTELLDELREAAKRHEREAAQLREGLSRARAEGRLEVVKRMLPALDGMDEALASGERLLTGRSASRTPPEASGTPSRLSPGVAGEDASRVSHLTFGQRLNAAVSLLFAPAKAEPRPGLLSETVSRDAVAGWLQGLGLVQERLLDLLAADGVYPVETEDETFDPHQHVALDSVPATGGLAPGSIVRELRRGYRREDGSVLRYAEVVVARGPEGSR